MFVLCGGGGGGIMIVAVKLETFSNCNTNINKFCKLHKSIFSYFVTNFTHFKMIFPAVVKYLPRSKFSQMCKFSTVFCPSNLPLDLCRTSRNSQHGDLIECDFCPLSFHTNCLQPPLTNRPLGMWMCPNHAEHAEVKHKVIDTP